MDWIKRNLYFLIGALVALALMGLAGYYCYSNWKSNNDILTQLNTNYEELRRLNEQKPHPGSGKVDNIKAAKEQQQQVVAFIGKVRPHFEPIQRIPDLEKVTGQDFSGALSRTLSQLQREATNASVNLPPDYSFSFSAQKNLVSFSANSPGPLSVQLGEVKAICDILIAARVNSLDGLRREKICADDNQGTLSDYTDKKSITNTLAILTPYEVSFRCFTPELANVLAGFASSPHNFVVTAINVDPAPAPAVSEAPAQPVPIMIIPQGAGATGSSLDPSEAQRAEAMRRRYGLSGRGGGRYGGAPEPQEPAYVSPLGGGGTAPVAAAPGKPGKGGLQTVLNERPLKVIMTLSLVKLLPPKAEPAPPKATPAVTRATPVQ